MLIANSVITQDMISCYRDHLTRFLLSKSGKELENWTKTFFHIFWLNQPTLMQFSVWKLQFFCLEAYFLRNSSRNGFLSPRFVRIHKNVDFAFTL